MDYATPAGRQVLQSKFTPWNNNTTNTIYSNALNCHRGMMDKHQNPQFSRRHTQNEDDLKNEDNLKKEDNLKN